MHDLVGSIAEFFKVPDDIAKHGVMLLALLKI